MRPPPAAAMSSSSVAAVNRARADVAVVIPAWNEEGSIGRVIDALPDRWHRQVVVADNNSTDGTADAARSAGATVVHAPRLPG